MTSTLSVTEVRNALRCPRIFALGRLRHRQVAFPIGASSLGATFHRVVERLAGQVDDPPRAMAVLEDSASEARVADVLAGWLLEFLAREIDASPAYTSMPAEVDDLAEALRHFAAYLAHRCREDGRRPIDALRRFLAGAELDVASSIEVGGGRTVLVNGRIDALHVAPDGSAEVVEYKLTDIGNDEIDRAQVALYRHLLGLARTIDSTPVILRFNPALTVTRVEPVRADALVRDRLLPLLRDMDTWAEHPERAAATDRTDLCAACPLRTDCAETYSDELPARDEPPSGSSRPRPKPTGELEANATVPRRESSAPVRDDAGTAEAQMIRDEIVAVLRKQNVHSPLAKPPLVGARVIQIEISVARGKVAWVDRAADDVVHRLHAGCGRAAEYVRRGGLRFFAVARTKPRDVHLHDLLASRGDWLRERAGRFVLGEAVDGTVLVGDLGDPSSCHLLIGGTTGSGKSVLLRAIVASLAQYHSPEAIRFTLVDPKRVSFARFASGLAAHMANPVCHDAEQTLPILEGLIEEMEDRYAQFEAQKVQDIDELNAIAGPRDRLARHVVVVDEFQDLLASKNTREPFVAAVQRLGAKARASGIHLILATQRPSRENVPGSIKANLPGHVALRTSSALESRIILDTAGAEALLGRGDLLADLGHGPVRAQAPLT